jgi:hypothetical protein
MRICPITATIKPSQVDARCDMAWAWAPLRSWCDIAHGLDLPLPLGSPRFRTKAPSCHMFVFFISLSFHCFLLLVKFSPFQFLCAQVLEEQASKMSVVREFRVKAGVGVLLPHRRSSRQKHLRQDNTKAYVT